MFRVEYAWAAVVISIGVYLLLGYVGSKRTRELIDFTIGGAKLGPYVLGIATAATVFSAGTFVGYVGWSYSFGYCNLWIYFAMFCPLTVGMLVYARIVREANIQQRSQSLPDWLGDFYNSDYLRLGVAILSLFNLFYLGAQLTGGAYLFEVCAGLPYRMGLLLITAIVTVYVVAGGTFADVYTDLVQGLLMAGMGLIVFVSAPFVLGEAPAGFFIRLTQHLKDINPNLVGIVNPKSPLYYAPIAVIGLSVAQFTFTTQPQVFNKVLAINNPRNLRKMMWAYVVTVALLLLVLFTGFFAQFAGVEVEKPDHVVYRYVASLYHPIVGALLIGVILAAALSTTDGLIIALATVFSNDLYRKFLVKRGILKEAGTPQAESRRQLAISRIATVGVSLIAMLFVWNAPPYIGTLLWIGVGGVSSGVVGPLLIGIFMKDRVTSTGAGLSLIIGSATFSILLVRKLIPSIYVTAMVGIIVGTVVMLLYTLVFPRAPGRKLDEARRAL